MARIRTARKQRGSRFPGAETWEKTPRWLRLTIMWAGGLAALVVLFLLLAVAFAARSLPSYEELKAAQTAQTIVVRAADGSEIVELGPSYGEWLDKEEIPAVMKQAMIAVEDRRFYSHFGVDIWRTGGAFLEPIMGSRARVAGTSTITQQLARNVFLNSNRTIDRKLREAVLALALEAKFDKEQILELYLNKVYFGGGAYGVDSASRKFFSHPATELSTAEAAIIAGLVKAPSRYSPTADVDAAVGRAQVVLRLMREQGRITAEQASVDPSAVKLKEETGQNSVRYFTDWALPQLDILLPNTLEPIEVWTTIDIGMQGAATAAIKSNAPEGAQGALVALDRDGAIRALVGGTDYVTSNFNRATVAQRQPGSAWKLFVYLAALESGYRVDDTVVDAPITIGDWSPRNYNGRFAGEMTVRQAFAYSVNTVAAQLGNEVGFGTVASMARRFGITSEISTFPSMVLGSSTVRLLDMTRAFAAVSAGGMAVEPYGIVKVTTTGGETLYQHEQSREVRLVPDYVATQMTDLLQAAVQTGTGRAAQIGRPVAGKTGTTSSNKDGYFVGFSSGITTGVWMGRDDNKAVSGLSGGRAPAQAFAAFMRFAVKDRPVEPFNTDTDLPEWQIEPDEEFYYGDPDDYYFIDEQGNLIEPGRGAGEAGPASEGVTERPRPQPGEGADGEPQAVDDDFLDRAIGGGNQGGQGARNQPPQQQQPPQPRPSPQPAQPGRGEAPALPPQQREQIY
ncbi:transglycosylase domain-containing protein [Citromicrobium bathyomarinum]|uniref:transglycosylase domain-containing protein n=1 Tax=Citromicrobium bathyomarinum TaxID=72174 RepID=UPI003CC91692